MVVLLDGAQLGLGKVALLSHMPSAPLPKPRLTTFLVQLGRLVGPAMQHVLQITSEPVGARRRERAARPRCQRGKEHGQSITVSLELTRLSVHVTNALTVPQQHSNGMPWSEQSEGLRASVRESSSHKSLWGKWGSRYCEEIMQKCMDHITPHSHNLKN